MLAQIDSKHKEKSEKTSREILKNMNPRDPSPPLLQQKKTHVFESYLKNAGSDVALHTH